MKRNAGTTASYETPTTCADFITMAGAMNDAIAEAKYTAATSMGNAMLAADEDDISCSASEKESLEDTKDDLDDSVTALSSIISALEIKIAALSTIIDSLG